MKNLSLVSVLSLLAGIVFAASTAFESPMAYADSEELEAAVTQACPTLLHMDGGMPGLCYCNYGTNCVPPAGVPHCPALICQ